MGIKCSLLGHRFTETEVAEEREEQGSEVVITIKEIETCERCGTERIVSENKEVTSLETAEATEPAAETGPETAEPESPSGPSPSTGTSPAPDMDAVEDDAELLGEGDDTESTPEPTGTAAETEAAADAGTAAGTEPTDSVTAETEAGTEVGSMDDPAPSAAEDDAVILDDGDDEPSREPGEWPDETEGGDAAATDAAEDDEASEGAAVEAWPDEADSGPEANDASPDDVAWPDEGRGADEDEWEPSESLTQKIDQAEVEPAGSATVTVPEGDFECPECGFTTSVESTSLRAGDFCPECRRGSLEHVPEDETRKE